MKEVAQSKIKISDLEHQLSVVHAERSRLDRNKRMATAFLQAVVGDQDVTAVDRYLGETYIQHNPGIADGPDALKEWLRAMYLDRPGKRKLDFRQVCAEGDLVWFQVAIEVEIPVRTRRRISIVETFRFEDDKIVEHWDTRQEIDLADAKNAHPLF